jgi:hypothetical protein
MLGKYIAFLNEKATKEEQEKHGAFPFKLKQAVQVEGIENGDKQIDIVEDSGSNDDKIFLYLLHLYQNCGGHEYCTKKDKRTVENVEDGTTAVEDAEDDDEDVIGGDDDRIDNNDENTTIGTVSDSGASPLPQIVYKGCLSMIPLLFKYLFLKARHQCPLIVQLLAVSTNLTTKGQIISLATIGASRADLKKVAATAKKEITTAALAPGGRSKKDLEAEVSKAIVQRASISSTIQLYVNTLQYPRSDTEVVALIKDLTSLNQTIRELNDKISTYEEEYQRNQALYMKPTKVVLSSSSSSV